MSTPRDVIEFWFSSYARSRWFAKEPAFDDAIRTRFGATVEQAAQGTLDSWGTSPEGALALIILLDQFSRNLFRDTPAAFANDAKALELATRAVDAHHDVELPLEQRAFLYMPFEHSESLRQQDRGVELFRRWVASHEPAERAEAERTARYADLHRDIIARFGRFPHRNAVLGRASTAEELAFLATPGSSF